MASLSREVSWAVTSAVVTTNHGLPNTIEHIESIDPEDIPRFAELDVIASLQGEHLPQENNEKLLRIGEERCRYEWPFRSLVDAGATLAFGRAKIIEDLEMKHKIVDYLVEKYSPGLEEGVHETFAERITWMGAFEIEVEHLSGKEAIELAVPGWQLDELKD